VLSSFHGVLDDFLTSIGIVCGVCVCGVAVKSVLGGTLDGVDGPGGRLLTRDGGSGGAPCSVGHCVSTTAIGVAEVSQAGKGGGGAGESQSFSWVISSPDGLVVGGIDVLSFAVRADELVGFTGGAKDGNDIIVCSSESLGDDFVHMLLGELFADNSEGGCNCGGGNSGSISSAFHGVGGGRDDSGEESCSKGLHDHLCSRNIISFLFVKSLGIYNS